MIRIYIILFYCLTISISLLSQDHYWYGHKRIPLIQSAQEMQENGVGINELQTQLLQKIEELTLYILQQEERIKALEAELNK